MKYNKAFEDGNFQDYLTYLESIKNELSGDIYQFVSDPTRHDLRNRSLHDSRIMEIICNADNIGNQNIKLKLKGEGREFELSFINVSQYQIKQFILKDLYRDLITFEIGIEEDMFRNRKKVFRAQFPLEKGDIEIYCEEIQFKEDIYDKV